MIHDPAFERAKKQLDQAEYFFLVTLDAATGQLVMMSAVTPQLQGDDRDNLVALSHRIHQMVMNEIENNAQK